MRFWAQNVLQNDGRPIGYAFTAIVSFRCVVVVALPIVNISFIPVPRWTPVERTASFWPRSVVVFEAYKVTLPRLFRDLTGNFQGNLRWSGWQFGTRRHQWRLVEGSWHNWRSVILGTTKTRQMYMIIWFGWRPDTEWAPLQQAAITQTWLINQSLFVLRGISVTWYCISV